MKKYLRHLGVTIVFVMMTFNFNGCILDAFNTILLNIPITIANVNISGLLAQNSASEDFCLSESELYQDFQSKINQIDLLDITLRPTEVSPNNLSGEVVLTISRQDNGTVLLTRSLGVIKSRDYLDPNPPFELNLTNIELQLLNAYLNANGDCFNATVTVNNMSPGVGVQKNLVFSIDLMFNADADL